MNTARQEKLLEVFASELGIDLHMLPCDDDSAADDLRYRIQELLGQLALAASLSREDGHA